jgi:hypothetical protein
MAQQIFFPFNPEGMDWQHWNGNLIMYFGTELIPYTTDENDWKMVAKNVSQLPRFTVYPVSDPDLYENWQDWALEFTQIINGPSQ